MKNSLLFAGATALLLAACQPSGEAADNRSFAYFGDTIETAGALSPEALLEQLKTSDSIAATVEAPIDGVCQAKGCWMDLNMGNGQTMTVRFKDYAFFVPMDATGKKAVVSGYVKVDTLSVDWLKHKASDAGKSQAHIDSITEPRVEYSFLANGVAIEAEAAKK
jgi:hypothetical protein